METDFFRSSYGENCTNIVSAIVIHYMPKSNLVLGSAQFNYLLRIFSRNFAVIMINLIKHYSMTAPIVRYSYPSSFSRMMYTHRFMSCWLIL